MLVLKHYLETKTEYVTITSILSVPFNTLSAIMFKV